jgi:hypothetical protein
MMVRRRNALRLIAPVAVLALAVSACGGSDDSASANTSATTDASDMTMPDGTTMPHDETGTKNPTAAPAAELRAGLTNLLEEHVYLAGITTGTALAGGDMKPAAATLDTNSVALSEAIGSVYGDEAAEQFLALWRAHIGMFVDYTNATATGDEAARAAALDDLSGYANDFAAFLGSANPKLDESAIVESLGMHVQTLTAAIDAQGDKDPTQFAKLREAAQHMPSTAAYLAQVIAEQFPDKFGS